MHMNGRHDEFRVGGAMASGRGLARRGDGRSEGRPENEAFVVGAVDKVADAVAACLGIEAAEWSLRGKLRRAAGEGNGEVCVEMDVGDDGRVEAIVFASFHHAPRAVHRQLRVSSLWT